MITKLIEYKILRKYADDAAVKKIADVIRKVLLDAGTIRDIGVIPGTYSHIIHIEVDGNTSLSDVFNMGALVGGLIVELYATGRTEVPS